MMDKTNFWGEHEGDEPRGVRAETRHTVAIGRLSTGRNVCFGKGGGDAPKPDPAIGEAAKQNVDLGREQLELARQQYEDNKVRQNGYDKLTDQVAKSALDSQDLANKWAQDDRDIQAGYRDKYDGWADQDRQLGRDTKALDDKLANEALESGKAYEGQFQQQAARQNGLGAAQMDRYGKTFSPVEDKVASDAMNWDSADRQEAMAAEAKADVVAAGQQAKDANARQMMSMGVNPMSGKFAATSQAGDTALALAGAGAQNMARDNVRMQGVQLRQNAAQLGQQVLASGQQANSLGMQATGAAQTARTTGISTAMQAQNQGLAAAGIGNTTASLGLSNQGGGYTGLGTGLAAGGAATGAVGAANANNFNTNNAMMTGMNGAAATTASGAQIGLGLYNANLNQWGQQQQTKTAMWQGIGQAAAAAAAAY
jgi:hypothetical protein